MGTLGHSFYFLTFLPPSSPKMFLWFVFQVERNPTEQTADVSMVGPAHVVSLCESTAPTILHTKKRRSINVY